jgi:hypothetical protein
VPAPEQLARVARELVVEFATEIPEDVVLAYVSKAAAAVVFFGDDPDERHEWVRGIARNELTLLSGRDTDRART